MIAAFVRTHWMLILGLILIAAAAATYALREPRPSLPGALASLSKCFSSNIPEDKADLDCLGKAAGELVAAFEPKDLMREVMRTNLPFVARNCHLIGHDIGRAAYLQSSSLEDALSRCSSECRGACVHGALAAGVEDEIGESADDLAHADIETLKSIGKKYCERSVELCHGIGHVLYISLKDHLKALRVCDNFGDRASACYSGVFMEGAGTADSLSPNSATSTPNDLNYPCTGIAARYRSSCFRYSHAYQSRLFEINGVRTASEQLLYSRKACESLPPDARSDCFYGLGTYAYRLRDDSGERANLAGFCNKFGTPIDRKSCVVGVVRSRVTGSPDWYMNAIQYCAAQIKETKEICYLTAFQIAEQNPVDFDSAVFTPPELCGAYAAPECEDYRREFDALKTKLPEYYFGYYGKRE